jgi:predicted nucleotidyltransferase
MDDSVEVSVGNKQLAEICMRYGVRELSLFGSAVRGEMGPDSDIDLLVVFSKSSRIGLIEFARLQHELTELFGRPVDLVPKDGLKPALKSEVLSQARTLYAA